MMLFVAGSRTDIKQWLAWTSNFLVHWWFMRTRNNTIFTCDIHTEAEPELPGQFELLLRKWINKILELLGIR